MCVYKIEIYMFDVLTNEIDINVTDLIFKPV